MPYELPTQAFNYRLYAENRVIAANQFRESVIQKYIDSYEEFWAINRDEVTIVEMQGILDEMGAVAIEILTDAQRYSAALEANYPGELDPEYLESPYNYNITKEGRIVLVDLKEAWLPPPEEESENNDNGNTDPSDQETPNP